MHDPAWVPGLAHVTCGPGVRTGPAAPFFVLSGHASTSFRYASAYRTPANRPASSARSRTTLPNHSPPGPICDDVAGESSRFGLDRGRDVDPRIGFEGAGQVKDGDLEGTTGVPGNSEGWRPPGTQRR